MKNKKQSSKARNRWSYVVFGVIILLMAGFSYAWSVFSQPIGASHPDWTSARLSLTYTLSIAFLCVGSLITGIFSKKIKPQFYILMAGILMFCGLMIASMTKDSPAALYLGYGILCGTASGFAYNTVLSVVCEWFPDRHGQISGILLMGFGISSFILGKLFAAVTPTDGSNTWCITFRYLALLLGAVLVICSFFIARPDDDFEPPQASKKKNIRTPALDIAAGQMVRKPSFWLSYFWVILVSSAGLALIAHASGIALQTGARVTAGQIATAVGMISIMNGVGRVCGGSIFDRGGFRITMAVTMAGFIVTSLLLILSLRGGSFPVVVIAFFLGGLSYGCIAAIPPSIIRDFFGGTFYSLNFSIFLTEMVVASFSSTIAGKLYDVSQNYITTAYLMIIVVVAGFVLFLGIRRPKA